VRFTGLHLSEENDLLFSAQAESPLHGSYKTLLKANLGDRSKEVLTFFPEKVLYLEDSGLLQIQNRLGLFRADRELKKVSPVPGFPSFTGGKVVETGKLGTIASSPDGRYMIYIDKRSHAYGSLILFFVESGREVQISQEVGLSYDEPAVSWSPDSQYFVYRKRGNLYYYSVDQLLREEVVEEKFRRIGEGSLRNTGWSGRSSLIYIKRSAVYRIGGAEFFTRSFYSELLDAGEIVGKIPFRFDPNFDDFYVSPDGKKILFNKGGRNLLLYFLSSDDYLSTGEVTSLPYLYLPRNTRTKEVLWSSADIVTVFTGSIRGGRDNPGLYRLSLFDEKSGKLRERLSFETIEAEGVRSVILSDDQDRVAVVRTDGVEIRRYSDWRRVNSVNHPSPLHAVWKNSEELIVAGEYRTEIVDLESGETGVIALSRAGEYGFTEGGGIRSNVGGSAYLYADGSWVKGTAEDFLPPQTTSASYRVYVEPNPPGVYVNSIMIRDITGYGTESLFDVPTLTYEPFPEEDETVSEVNFAHGSRIRRREVALVFNAVDTVEGLTEVLTILNDYGIRCTFFVNGEFVRRNPEAAQELSGSVHEIGSLFYAYFNMTDSRYRIDREFIKQGLARNEDEFYQATGSELSLLWHAPYYFINSEIIRASVEMNYTYVGRDIDPLDWVPQSDCSDGMYKPGRELVERVLQKKKPGSIIPIRIGSMEKEREDYLFQYLDLIINGLMSQGYEVVPVSSLIHHAK